MTPEVARAVGLEAPGVREGEDQEAAVVTGGQGHEAGNCYPDSNILF